MDNAQTVFYLDNEAASAGLIKAFGATQHAEAIVERVTHIEADVCNKPWYGRVPTSSNVSDDPSRLECDELREVRCHRSEIDWNVSVLQVV